MMVAFALLVLDGCLLGFLFHWLGAIAQIAGRSLGTPLPWSPGTWIAVALFALSCRDRTGGFALRPVEPRPLAARVRSLALAVLFWPCLVYLAALGIGRTRVLLVAGAAGLYCLLISPLLRHGVRRLLIAGRPRDRLLTAGLALAGVAWWLWPSSPPGAEPLLSTPARTNLLLITLESTRADALGCYGQDLPTSPAMDRLAREGTLLEQAIAQAPHTHSSIASLLTSLYPLEHRSICTRPALVESRVTLAEHLARCGYRTAAFLDNPWLREEFGFHQGYEDFREHARTAEILEWLGEIGEDRFFLHVHYFQPHGPYEPQQPWIDTFSPDYQGDWKQVPASFLEESERPGASLSDGDLQRFRALYASEIRAMDREVGALLSGLDELGQTEQTLVVVVADHGEEFLDHGGLNHSHTLYDELVRVPLLVRLPGVVAEGQRIQEQMELIDTVPTVLDLLGLPPLSSARGTSWAKAWRGDARPPGERLAVSQRYRLGDRHLLSARAGRFKLHVLVMSSGPDRLDDWTLSGPVSEDFIWGNRCQLFDLEADPGERRDVAAEHPEVVQDLLERLRAWRAVHDSTRQEPDPAGAIDPEALQKLRELGYTEEADRVESDLRASQR